MSAEIMSRVMETQWGDPLFKFFMLTLADGINPDGEFTLNIPAMARSIEVTEEKAQELFDQALKMQLAYPTNQFLRPSERIWILDLDNPSWNRLARWKAKETQQ